MKLLSFQYELNKLCIHCKLIKRYERMVLFDIETNIEKPPTTIVDTAPQKFEYA